MRATLLLDGNHDHFVRQYYGIYTTTGGESLAAITDGILFVWSNSHVQGRELGDSTEVVKTSS